MPRSAPLLQLALLTAVLSLGSACLGGAPARPKSPASQTAAKPTAAAPADSQPCDFKVVPLSDPAQRQIQCANGESFVVRLGVDGQWHEEVKARAGTAPGYATLATAARARCGCAAGS